MRDYVDAVDGRIRMRRSEILELTWDRVFLDRRMVLLPKTKNGKQRWVAMGDDILLLLTALPKHVATDRVFTYRGQPIREIKHSWDTAREAAGIAEGHFHDLRHTWASRMVAKGIDLYTLMELGGWSDVGMVRRYAHFAPEQKIRAAQLLDGTARVTA